MDELLVACKPVEKLFRKKDKPELYEKLAEKLEVYRFADGEPVYEDTDVVDDGLYVIIAGKVDVINREGKFLYSLKEGDFFGADALFNPADERGENVRAKGELTAAALPVENFEAMKKVDPDLAVFVSQCLCSKYDKDFQATETKNAEKERGAKGLLFAILLLFFTSYYSNLLSVLAADDGVGLGAVIIFYVGIVALIGVWFLVGKIPKNEIGFGNYLTWRDTILNLVVVAELCALFFLGAMLADSGYITALTFTEDYTGTGYFVFIIMAVIYTLIYIICAGYLPVAVSLLLPGKLGEVLSYIVPAIFAMVIFGAIGGAISALWLGITVFSFTVVRIKTGNTAPTAVGFLVALAIGTFAFHISYIPLMVNV